MYEFESNRYVKNGDLPNLDLLVLEICHDWQGRETGALLLSMLQM